MGTLGEPSLPRSWFGGWEHAAPWLNRELPPFVRRVSSEAMSTVTEIKEAVSKLPSRKKLAIIRWMQTQVDVPKSDLGTAARANEGVRKLKRREAAEARRFLGDFDKAVKTIAAGSRPAGSVVATLSRMRR